MCCRSCRTSYFPSNRIELMEYKTGTLIYWVRPLFTVNISYDKVYSAYLCDVCREPQTNLVSSAYTKFIPFINLGECSRVVLIEHYVLNSFMTSCYFNNNTVFFSFQQSRVANTCHRQLTSFLLFAPTRSNQEVLTSTAFLQHQLLGAT